jgi:hypothetical protein
MIRFLLILLFSCTAFSQPQYYDVYVSDCSQNTVITKHTIVKLLVFKSEMLPMSYNTKLKLGMIKGKGIIVSPSSLTDRRPKDDEVEPTVILTLPLEYYEGLTFGEFVNVIYN